MVNIHVTGPETRRRELLAIVRAAFDQQHRDLKGLSFEERVVIPEQPHVTVSYRKLISLEDRGIGEYEPDDLDNPVSVRRLLNGLDSPKSRERKSHESSWAKPIHISQIRGKVHAAVITVRHDEYDAVEALLDDSVAVDGGNNSYEYATVSGRRQENVSIVLTRCVAQGNLNAQSVTNNIIADLDPSWIFLVGIAGAVPDFEFSLGDVIIASSLHDFSFGAGASGGIRTYQTSGSAMHADVTRFIQTKIGGRNRQLIIDLAGFKTRHLFQTHPAVFPPHLNEKDAFIGSKEFQDDVRRKLVRRFPNWMRNGPPVIWSGPCANGNIVVKDPLIIRAWQESARQIVEVETELAGVYEAARTSGRQNYPILAIRGLSDIVGLIRDPAWTQYACDTAAAIAMAILRSGFIDFDANLPTNMPLNDSSASQLRRYSAHCDWHASYWIPLRRMSARLLRSLGVIGGIFRHTGNP